MFKRRIPLSFAQSLRQNLWPRMGWWRFLKYYRLRVVRLSSSAESIAVNLAGGSAMSFTPFFGIHIFGAMAIAWLVGVRMNLIAATVGTFVGNPWTFPFLLYSSHRLGHFILNFFRDHAPETKVFDPEAVTHHADNMMVYFWDHFWDIFLPTALGGTILAIFSFPLYYVLYYYLVRGAQRARKLRIKRKQRALFNKKSKG